jgi:hypothetical protein
MAGFFTQVVKGALVLGLAGGFAWPTAAQADEGRERAGAPADDPAAAYTLNVSSATGKVGQDLKVTVTVTANGDFHVNKDYPHKVTVVPVDGLEVPKAELVKADAVLEEKKLTFTVVAKPTKAGSFDLKGTVKFSVCSDAACHLEKKDISATVTAS